MCRIRRSSVLGIPTFPDSTGADIRRAVIIGAIVIAFAVATLVVAGLSAGGLRIGLVVATPLILFGGAMFMLVRTYRTWRADGHWQVWQGAAWFLLCLFVLTLVATAPLLVG